MPKTTLSIASEAFNGNSETGLRALQLRSSSDSSSSDDTESSTEVIDIQERSETISPLLSFMSSVNHSPVTNTIEVDFNVLEAAKKYNMHLIVREVRKQIEAKAEEQPLQVYAIALASGRATLQDEIRMAAKLSLKQVLTTASDLPLIPEFERITHGDYTRLVDYHKACADAISSLFRKGNADHASATEVVAMPLYICTFLRDYVTLFAPRASWLFASTLGTSADQALIPTHRAVAIARPHTQWAKIITGSFTHKGETAPEVFYATRWWAEWMMEAVEKLIRRPHPATMTDEFFNDLLVKAISTQPNQADVPAVIRHFREAFTEAVTRAVSKVRTHYFFLFRLRFDVGM